MEQTAGGALPVDLEGSHVLRDPNCAMCNLEAIHNAKGGDDLRMPSAQPNSSADECKEDIWVDFRSPYIRDAKSRLILRAEEKKIDKDAYDDEYAWNFSKPARLRRFNYHKFDPVFLS